MSPDRKTARNFLLTAASALFLIPPAFDIGHTGFVYDAMSRGWGDCSDGIKQADPTYPADAIVVPIADANSQEGLWRLEAAAIAYSKRIAPKIILLGGEKDAQQSISMSQIYLQHSYNLLTGKFIPPWAILEDYSSFNTATNMEELAKVVKQNKINTVVVITNRYHTLRATLLACANEIPAFSLSAENLLIQHDLNRLGEINELYSSWEMMITTLKERLKVGSLFWGHKGEILTFLRSLVPR